MATDIEPSPAFAPQIGRVYLRVSTDAQDLRRQDAIVAEAKAAGYYVAAVSREKASGARADRPELLRMIADLQPGEVLIAEKIDRISRLPLTEAEQMVETIRARGTGLAIDRQRVVKGNSVYVRVDIGRSPTLKQKKKRQI